MIHDHEGYTAAESQISFSKSFFKFEDVVGARYTDAFIDIGCCDAFVGASGRGVHNYFFDLVAYFPCGWLDISCKCLECIRFKFPSGRFGSIGCKDVRSFDDREIMAIFFQRAERIIFQVFFFERISIEYKNGKFSWIFDIAAEFCIVLFLQLFCQRFFDFVKLPDNDKLF